MAKILISGFEPFDKDNSNPSELMVRNLEGKLKNLSSIILPVSFKRSFPLLKNKIDEFRPDYVIAFGLASIRDKITIERVAINFVDARIPDNDGNQPRDKTIIPEGENAYFSDLPLNQIENHGIEISNTAGTYVCNSLMYELLHYGNQNKFKSGFIHLPPTKEIKPESLHTIESLSQKILRTLEELK